MIDIQKTARVIEALIFASPAPVPRRALLPYLENEDQITEVLASIAARYDERSGIELSDIEGHYAFRTRADVAAFLTLERPIQRPLSRAALEVLAIIAYHQPVTRSEIEEIRGISLSRGTVDILLELGWIKPRGRRRTPGRPLTWGTSTAFLDHFGLQGVDDLPGIDELKSAGLLRKGQILGGIGEASHQDDDGPEDEVSDDLLDDDFLDGFVEEDA
ncbi:MAG: SMC-Scp complex subunit ScpB [Alphaproteobacteria bacterium]|nr:SMC-Scp complex subunit ScpB [Alphaproteobacteria bacterium]